MVSAFDTFKFYKALKLHFTTDSYDFKKYHGRTKNSSINDFNKAHDKCWFENLTKKYDKATPSFLLANLSETPTAYIKDLCSDSRYDEMYKKWSVRRKAGKYYFQDELSKLKELNFTDLFVCNQDKIAPLITYHIGQQVSKETVCIIINLSKSLPYLNSCMKENMFWEQYGNTYGKYCSFVMMKPEYTKILLDKYGTIDYK